LSQELGDLLLSAGALTEQELREAMAYQRNGGIALGEAVVKLGFSDEMAVARAVAKQNGLPFIDLDKGRVPEEILARLPAEFATEHGILPLMEKGGRLIVAVDDPFKKILAEQIEFMIDAQVACALAAPGALKRAIQRYYGVTGEEAVAARMGGGDDDEDAPIVRLVTKTFQDAVEMRASDIHVEPGHGRLRIRFRIDGMLRDIAEHQEHLAAPLLSRLKIMASMDIAEKRKPQDGRIALNIKGREIDVRASILPSNHGEAMVMRLLDRSASLIGLKELGFGPEDYEWFQRTIKRPNGICLVTGPTGSGKTTTLYAALSELNRPDLKIVTAEDPVEYHISGINQVQVNGRIGLSFARILKAMLRCAPNVILVGEIRDRETAEVAIQAALTGHLVFSTLHTNDAPGALTRLIDLGIKPFLVSASVRSVLAQRLVRVLCKECRAIYTPGAAELQAVGLDASVLAGRPFYKPQGCRACEGSGYRGRMALFESLDMDPGMRDLTFRGASLEELRSTAKATGSLRPLMTDGARRILDGVTTVAEVLRVTR
jgi:type IV pilus assembly protein PilB